MGEERLVKIVYNESKERLDKEEILLKKGVDINITNTWCIYTKKLLKELHLDEVWRNQVVPPEEEWHQIIQARIHDREQVHWRTQCLTKPKLRTYKN